MNLKDFARISVSKAQNKGQKTSVNVKAFAFYGAMAVGFAGILGGIVSGCSPAVNPSNVTNDNNANSSKPATSANQTANTEDSKAWDEFDKYDETAYREYITNLIKSYDKDASALEVQDVVNFAVQLNLFTTHANADLQSKSNFDADKDLLILSNKAESIMQKGNSDVKKTISDKNITDNLMSLSEQMKVCKVLTASPIELVEGATATVSVKAQPANAELNLVYSVKDTKVATVTDKGVVKGISNGSTVLTVTDKNTEVSTQVNINIKAKTVKVDSEKKTNDNTEKKTNDASTKESVDTSNKSESKPASKPSTSTQTKPTTTKTETKQAPKITATSVTLDINNLNLTAGGSRELNAYVHYSDGSSNYSGITWSSSNTGVATVDGYGNVYAHSAGTAQITASYGSFKASCSVTVKAAQQSKPQTQYTSNNNNSGGNSGNNSGSNSGSNSGGNSGGSGNNGGSITKKQTNTNNSGNNSGGSTTTKKQTNNGGNSGGNSGGNTQTKKQQTTSKWKASDHEKDKVYSSGGYVMYEMPEILPYVNYYRRQAGVPELEWRGGTAYYNKIKNMFYSLSKEEQKQTRNESPEWFNSKGEFDAKKCVAEDQIDTCNCLEYCLKTHTLDHVNEYGGHTSLINGTMASYDPQGKVESIKNNSPGHWEGLMDPELTTLYVVYGGSEETGFTITFN